MATVHDLATQSEVFESRPAWLEFAPNNLCNLRCVMCEQSDGVPLEVMRRDEVRAVLGDVLPTTTLWTPMALSEPLANDFRLIVEQAREHDLLLYVQSNGTLLTPERFTECVDRLFMLNFSFDSHRKEVYEAIRVGADYDKTVANLRGLIPLLGEHQVPMVVVAVLMADNAADLADFVDFIADLGGADVGVQIQVHHMRQNARGSFGRAPTDRYSAAEVEGFVDAACDRAAARNLTFNAILPPPLTRVFRGNLPAPREVRPDLMMKMIERIRREHPNYCSMAAHYVKIEPRGDVFPCCVAPPELRMGNVRERTFPEIWNGPEYREFRRRMFAGDYPEPCRACPARVSDTQNTECANGERLSSLREDGAGS